MKEKQVKFLWIKLSILTILVFNISLLLVNASAQQDTSIIPYELSFDSSNSSNLLQNTSYYNATIENNTLKYNGQHSQNQDQHVTIYLTNNNDNLENSGFLFDSWNSLLDVNLTGDLQLNGSAFLQSENNMSLGFIFQIQFLHITQNEPETIIGESNLAFYLVAELNSPYLSNSTLNNFSKSMSLVRNISQPILNTDLGSITTDISLSKFHSSGDIIPDGVDINNDSLFIRMSVRLDINGLSSLDTTNASVSTNLLEIHGLISTISAPIDNLPSSNIEPDDKYYFELHTLPVLDIILFGLIPILLLISLGFIDKIWLEHNWKRYNGRATWFGFLITLGAIIVGLFLIGQIPTPIPILNQILLGIALFIGGFIGLTIGLTRDH